MAESVKRTECVKVCFSERMMLDLNRLAIRQDRTLSELIYLWVRDRAYGELKEAAAREEGTERDHDAP